MLGKILITDLSGKAKELCIYDILEIKEGKGGGFLFDLGEGVEGKEPEDCSKIIYKNSKGEKKTINTKESVSQIRSKINSAKKNEKFDDWLVSIIK